MAATRTQIYLTAEQRARLDAIGRRQGASLAELVREAVDLLLDSERGDPATALAETYAAAPDFAVPARAEWGEREGRSADG